MSSRDNRFLGFSLTQTAIAGFGLAVATLLAVGAVQHRAIHSVVASDFWVTHTYKVLFELEAFQAELRAAEGTSRNYMLTGDDYYIQRYDTSVSRLTTHLAAVRRLTSDNPRQQRNLDQYEPVIQHKLQVMQELIKTRREEGFEAAFKLLRQGEGMRLMNELRSGVDNMTEEEERLLKTREAAGPASAKNADIVVAMGSLFALGIVVVVCAMLIRGSLERGRAEATLQRQAALIDQTYDPILVWDYHGPITFWNQGAEKLYGFARQEAVGRVSHELLRTTTAAGIDGFHATLERDGQWEGELQHTTRDGRRITVQSNMVLIKNAQGIQVLEANRDITERKQAEEVRAYLAAIVNSSEDAIFGKSLDGIVQTWNIGARKLYGYEASEIVGQPVYRLVPPDRHDEVARILASLGKGEAISHHETVRVRKDGSLMDVSVSPLKDAAGHVIGASSIARDITERKRAEIEIQQLNERLEHRVAERTAELAATNKELEAFSYSVSHDLRAPLRAIAGFSQVLVEDHGEKLDPEGRDFLARIRAATHRMSDLIDGLLGLARLTRQEIRREPVDLTALAHSVTQNLLHGEPNRHVDIVIAEGATAAGDRRLLDIVLQNLLSNAWKFTREQPQARIEFGQREESDKHVFYVRDNGAGFDMAYVAKLFGAFQRLHAQSEFEGHGIGLATVQRIIRRHGGRIWAEASVGNGAMFSFTL